MKPDLVIWHGPSCLDGQTAAWAIWKRWPDCEFVPANYGNEPPDVAGKHVLIVDFSYKRDVLLRMSETAESITVLDHHKSAQEDLASWAVVYNLMWPANLKGIKGRPPIQALFDTTKSGAMLAWEYAHPGKPAPMMVLNVQDRDLWKFEAPWTREVAAFLHAQDFSFELWSSFAEQIDDHDLHRYVVTAGAAIMQAQMKDIRQAIKSTMRMREIDGHMVPIANLPYAWASEAGNIMAVGQPFAATWFSDAHGVVRFSLRSTDAGLDVSKIAEKFGGGGHRNAAGFSLGKGDPLP